MKRQEGNGNENNDISSGPLDSSTRSSDSRVRGERDPRYADGRDNLASGTTVEGSSSGTSPVCFQFDKFPYEGLHTPSGCQATDAACGILHHTRVVLHRAMIIG